MTPIEFGIHYSAARGHESDALALARRSGFAPPGLSPDPPGGAACPSHGLSPPAIAPRGVRAVRRRSLFGP